MNTMVLIQTLVSNNQNVDNYVVCRQTRHGDEIIIHTESSDDLADRSVEHFNEQARLQALTPSYYWRKREPNERIEP